MITEQELSIPKKPRPWGSLIWILILWGTIRLITELDGINWTRGFFDVAFFLGAIPASCFLIFGLLSKREKNLRKAKKYALLTVGSSPLFGIVLNEIAGDSQWFSYGLLSWQLMLTLAYSVVCKETKNFSRKLP